MKTLDRILNKLALERYEKIKNRSQQLMNEEVKVAEEVIERDHDMLRKLADN